MFFKKGKRCSWHVHNIKTEHFYIHSGQITVVFGFDDDITKAKLEVLGSGDVFFIPPGLRHQMIATEDTELFEFSTQHFEDDSIRIIKGD